MSLNWTSAEKSDVRNYCPGQVLEFHRAGKDVAKHESLEVIGVENNKVIARNPRGEEREITAKQAKYCEVYERRSLEVAPNDKLLLIANRREPDFRATNGELVTVSRISEQGRIHLQDGRILPDNHKQFTHGYTVTAHRSQGKTVDAVVISADAMRKELFYVAASRGRESINVVTSDKELLRESVARSDVRQSASELERKAQNVPLEAREPRLSLREQNLRDLPAAHKHRRDVVQDLARASEKAPTAAVEQTINRENPTSGHKQEPMQAPSHYFDIGL